MSGHPDNGVSPAGRGVGAPRALTVHSRSRVLEIEFADGLAARLPFELLRVYSPSAEVTQHRPGGEGILQVGKQDVAITAVEPVGHYAVRIRFDDGHHTGIYSWTYLRDLADNRERYWERYLQRLREAGYQRDDQS